jgi:hypothetical protein
MVVVVAADLASFFQKSACLEFTSELIRMRNLPRDLKSQANRSPEKLQEKP